MKRLIALTMALGMILSCTACAEKNTENSGNSAPLAETQKLILNAADIRLANNFKSIKCLSHDPLGGNILTFGELKSGGYAGFSSKNDFGDYTQFRFTPQEGEFICNAALLTGGRKAVLTTLDGETLIYVFDRDGNIQKNLNCGEILTKDRFNNIYNCKDGFIINDDNSILTIVSLDGEILGTIDLTPYHVHGVSLDSEGIPTVVYSGEDTTYTAQIEKTKLVNKQECSVLTDTAYTMTAGFGEYRLAAMFNGMLYGLKDNSWVKLCDFIDNDFNSTSIYSLTMTGENEFAAAMTDASGSTMKLLTEADISVLESKTVIRVANLVSGDLVNTPAKAYNSAKPDSPYRVEVKDYGNANSLYDDRITELHQDILSGNAPDVITFNNEITPGSFGARESIFVDLYTLLDKDTELKREDFLDGYLEGLDFNGKLLQISPCFTFKTMVVKDKFLDGLTSWNYDQFAERINAIPEEMKITQWANMKLENNFLKIVDYSEFVDYENAVCNFENEGFIKALNIVRDNHIGLTLEEYDSWMNESGGFDAYNQGQYINDNCMIYEMDLGGWYTLRQTLHAQFNEPATLVGYPNENGNGSFVVPLECMGIMANSPCIDGAWDFIKTVYFSEEFYSNKNGVYGSWYYPTVEEYYIKQLEEQKNATYTDENGETIRGDNFWIGPDSDDFITYYEFTDEECEKYDKIVREAAKDVRQGDNVIYNIIREETMPFFEGEYTAEKTAEIIQNRVSIYLSEKYG